MMAINPDIDCGRCPRFCARFVEWPAHFRFHVITTQGRAGLGPTRAAAVDIVRPGAEYDGIVRSGDVTRALIAGRAGARVFHIGPERDLGLFEELHAPLAPLEDADYAVCSGLFDDTVETPQDYQDLVARMRARALPMICANPDAVVEPGHNLAHCPPAIADPSRPP